MESNGYSPKSSTGIEKNPAKMPIHEPLYSEKFAVVGGYDINRIRKVAQNSQLGKYGIRTFGWRAFLNIIPDTDDKLLWVNKIKKDREMFDKMVKDYDIMKNSDLDPNIFNPLAMNNPNNPWASFFQDNNLKNTIKMDIDRTYQEREFFKRDDIKEQMTTILLFWSKRNEKISYKQGMNEILATVMFAFHSEKIKNEYGDISTVEISSDDDKLVSFMNDSNYIVADMFAVFDRIMNLGIKELFLPTVGQSKNAKKKESLFSWSFDVAAYNPETQVQKLTPILKKCYRIYHVLLKNVDKELFEHLKTQKVEPQMHLLRWLRCLLSREFHISDVLIYWDVIFSFITKESLEIDDGMDIYDDENFFELNKDPLIFLDLICVAMVAYVKHTLLQSDETGCLQRLLKYPPLENPSFLIEMALNIRELDYLFRDKGLKIAEHPINRLKANSETIEEEEETKIIPEPAIPLPPEVAKDDHTKGENFVVVKGDTSQIDVEKLVTKLNQTIELMNKQKQRRLVDDREINICIKNIIDTLNYFTKTK